MTELCWELSGGLIQCDCCSSAPAEDALSREIGAAIAKSLNVLDGVLEDGVAFDEGFVLGVVVNLI